MDDLAIVQMLIDTHKAATHRWENEFSDEIWPDEMDLQDALSDELDRTAAALCFYRPTSLEGVHLKAEFMIATQFFVDRENEPFLRRVDLISAFLPAGKDVKAWKDLA